MKSEILRMVLTGLLCAAVTSLRAQETGALDMTFDASLSHVPGVSALAVQADGKVILGGGGVSRRLKDGSVDPTFHPPPLSRPDQIMFLPDGKILMSGAPGETSVMRTHADGTEDLSFRVGSTDLNPLIGNADVARMAPQADGKVVAVGSEIHIGGSSGIARLNADGSRDISFNAGTGFTGVRLIGGVAVQTDGRIIVAGDFDSFNGTPRKDIVRLHPDGSLDASYNPAEAIPELQVQDNFLQGIGALVLAGDGSVIAAVRARTEGVYKDFLVRIKQNGSVDSSFIKTGISEQGIVYRIALQPDGKILVSGSFSEFGGAPRSNFARALPDGGIDVEFVPAPVPGAAFDIGVSATGLIYLGGDFFATADFPRSGAARLFGAPQQPLSPEIFAQPDSKTVRFGAEAAFLASGVGYPAPQLQWLLNGRALPGETNRQLLLKAASFADAGQYRAVVSNSEGSASTSEATLTVLPARSAPGAVDVSFMPDEVEKGASVRVHGMARASQGGLYVAREVSFLDATRQRRATNEIVRMDAQGRLDTSYRVELSQEMTPQFFMRALLQQSDGKLVALWSETRRNTPPLNRPVSFFKRFNLDGSPDSSFAPIWDEEGWILDASLQTDGKFLIAGRFASAGGVARTNLARLLPDGSVDMSFDPARATNPTFQGLILPQVERVRTQEDGRMLVSAFGTMQLNADGSVDSSFPFLSGHLRTAGRYSDKSWLIAVDGSLRIGTDDYAVLARVNADNKHDPSFVPPVEGSVGAIVLQPDEKALIAGSFMKHEDANPVSIVRLNREGTLDFSFDVGAGPNGSAWGILPAPDGKVWVAGAFTHCDGYRRQGIVRLLNDSLLRITRTNAQNRLQAATYRGSRYRLESSESIVGEWSPLETLEGANSVREIIDPAPASGQRFYRLRIE